MLSPSSLSESLLRWSFVKKKSLRGRAIFSLFAFLALVLASRGAVPARAQSNTAQRAGLPAGESSEVVRGKYIVEGVAMCGQCHTPVDSDGNPDPSRWLQGGSVPWQSSRPSSDWPQMVPRIGGTPPATDAEMIKLLTTGIWTTGSRLRTPMPQFRMDGSDAAAVVAYLKSVKPHVMR